jgi:hypothetical protein
MYSSEGRSCDIIVLNVHTTTDDKTDDTEVTERVFDQFAKYNILWRDYNEKVGN